MDGLNHADQMRLANLITDNSDDADYQKKVDQVVELTNTTRDQAAVALHDCHYDVEKAVDMILEGDHNIVENQWKSAGKKKNKNLSSQAAKSGNQSGSHAANAGGKNANQASNKTHAAASISTSSSGQVATNTGGGNFKDSHHHHHHQQQPHHHQNSRGDQSSAAAHTATNNQFNNSIKQDISDSLKNTVDVASSNLMTSSDPMTTSTTAVTSTKTSSLQQQQPQQQQQQQQQSRQRGTMQIGNRQHHQRSTRIPESAVEMPNNELQVSSLNVQFGELDLRDGSVGATDNKGPFQDVIETNRLNRQSGPPNSHSTIPSQDGKSNRQLPQQQLGKGGPRRVYNSGNDDRKFYNNSNRSGRQISGNQRPYNQRQGQMNNNSGSSNNSRGGGNVRTILNRGMQPNSTLAGANANQAAGGFPNSIDTWTNSTAEAASKPSGNDQKIGVGNTLQVGQWSEVAGNEDWSEEEHWDAKVMETKVFTPSSKAVDGPVVGQKNQSSLLADTAQLNLASKLSESTRDDVNSQSVTQPTQSQQSSQKPITHMNDIFDPVAKAVLEQQNLASIKPKASIGIGQYNKESSDAKTVLNAQNLSSIKPKSAISMNQYNKEASESLKSLVGISSSSSSSSGPKAGVPSVPPGALPIMSQPPYIMGNAYQPAIFPYAYQAADVHYPVAAPTAGRDQNFQTVYSPNEGNKFNRGTDGDVPSIATTQTAPVASQTHNQAFVANALHAGYQLTYAMPGAFNMMPQNLYSPAPIFPHIPQPTNTGSANTVYQKNTPASYQHHTGYSGYDQLNPVIQDYINKQNYSGSNMQHQQPGNKSLGSTNELDVTTGGKSYNMYGTVNKGQTQPSKQANYNDTKGYQQGQMSNNGPQQQFGFSHNAHQSSSIAGAYPLLQQHNLDNSGLNVQSGGQSLHSNAQRGAQVNNPNKYYPSWN